jgi:uncharacterized protein (DUF58 family)
MALSKTLDPRILDRISRLDLKAKLIVEGVVSGQHRSPYKGFSIEFSDHREYVIGDDLRHLDWKVFAKSDKHYIKQYEEETNYKAQILVDVSQSMDYGEGFENKWTCAQLLAASMAFLVTSQQDMAGLTIFDTTDRVLLPQGSSQAHLGKFCALLEELTPEKETSILDALLRCASQQNRKGIVIVISDLFAAEEEILKGLLRLRNKGHEVIVFHVLHRDEMEFPFKEYTKFVGLENLGDLTLQPQALRKAYKEEVEKYLNVIRRGCRKSGIDYQLVVTDQALDALLAQFLSVRNARLTKGKR